MENGLTLSQANLLSELQVSLSVEMGQLSLSVEDLLDLIPGNSFEFEFDPLQQFALRLGTEEVGRVIFVLEQGKISLQVVSVAEVENGSQVLDDK